MRSFVLLLALAGAACGPKAAPTPPVSPEFASREALAQARDDVKKGDIDAADAEYAKAYDVGKSFAVLSERAEMLVHAGRAARAAEVAKGYYDANMTDIKGYDVYAETLLAQEKAQDALDVAEQMVQMNSDEPSAHEKRGRALLMLERTDDALDELRKAVHLGATNARYHIALGNALVKTAGLDGAEAEYRLAIKQAPDDNEPLVLLASVQRAQGKLDDANATLQKVLARDARNGRAYFELGLLYNASSRRANAEQALSQAVQLSPKESKFW